MEKINLSKFYQPQKVFFLLLLFILLFFNCSQRTSEDAFELQILENKLQFTQEMASGFARMALRCIQREYPNNPGHVVNSDVEVLTPRKIHPAFYGCFDWHSSVHGHWMLVRLLKRFPNLPEAQTIRERLNENLTVDNILMEVSYFYQSNRKSFERTYGWAWLLKLAEELQNWNDSDGHKWSENLFPLVQEIVNHYYDFLPKQTYPIRTGVHPNTAFGISFALDYAKKMEDVKFINMLVERSVMYFSNDKNYPVQWEPGGEDFLSPCFIEADLMRKVLGPKIFRKWFHRFLPNITQNQPANLLNPAIVTDRTDPKIVHLDGLNLSRAWCMIGIASVLREDDPYRKILIKSAIGHASNAFKNIASGNYEGEHWLASFAILTLSVIDEKL